jgi:hypothetical protein
MLRQITAILFLFIFSGQIFNGTVIVLDYYLNTSSFARNCENKARPLMHCNGKCQMMKRLKDQEQKEQQLPERKGEIKYEVILSRSFFAMLPFPESTYLKTFSSYFNTSFPKGIHPDIFHPPGLV